MPEPAWRSKFIVWSVTETVKNVKTKTDHHKTAGSRSGGRKETDRTGRER
jgi:hypothetical protein